jgi:hypothetical protein
VDSVDHAFHLGSAKNKSFQYNPAGARLQKLVGGPRHMKLIWRTVKKLAPATLQTLLKDVVSKDIPPLSESQKQRLTEYFRADAKKLHALTGINVLP